MIDYCDCDRLATRPAIEIPPPGFMAGAASDFPVAGRHSPVPSAARQKIAARDKSWRECKLADVPSAYSISQLRLQNDDVVKMLAASPAPFGVYLVHVELMLCKVCEMFCARCEMELAAEERRSSNLTIDFVRHGFQMARDAEEPPL